MSKRNLKSLDSESDEISKKIQKEELNSLLKEGKFNSDSKLVILEEKDFQNQLDKEIKKFLIPKLRSASYRWKARSEAIKASRRERGVYTCAICRSDMKNGEFTLDHIVPAIDLKEGFIDWNTFISRLFVPKEGWQVICRSCDKVKTDSEVQIRKLYRQKRKEEENSGK